LIERWDLTATKVPGRKNIVTAAIERMAVLSLDVAIAMLLIAMLSSRLSSAILREARVISRFIAFSLWAIRE
jgi:hypothetical protein